MLKKTPKLEIVGDYAKEYVISEDGKDWTFTLNDDFKFSNGEPVTSEDVKFTYDMLKEDGVNWDLSFLREVEIVDDHTIYPAADHGGIPSAVSPRDHSRGIYHLYRLWTVRTDTVHRLDPVGGCGPYLCWGMVAGGVSGRSPY